MYLKRNSSGYNILEEEARNVGAMDAMPRNMSKMEEGIYEVKACNISRDWETGEVDGCIWNLFRTINPNLKERIMATKKAKGPIEAIKIGDVFYVPMVLGDFNEMEANFNYATDKVTETLDKWFLTPEGRMNDQEN